MIAFLRRGRWSAIFVAGTWLLAGCFDFSGIKPTGDGGPRSDSAIEAGDACEAPSYACDGNELVRACEGEAEQRETCALGCAGTAPAAVCVAIKPSFISTANLNRAVLGTAEIEVLSGSARLNTDNGNLDLGAGPAAVPGYFTQSQDGAPGIGVFPLATLRVAEGAKLTIVGTRAAALVVRGNAIIDGTIDVSADGATGGPGGASGDVSDGELAAIAMNGKEAPSAYAYLTGDVPRAGALPGGGGGANGAAGGSGGGAVADTPDVNPAMASGGQPGEPAEGQMLVLRGGGAGGPADCGTSMGADLGLRGGGGGGALLISVSGSLHLGEGGVLLASGGGGRSRFDYPESAPGRCSGASGAGAGGGAGGTVVIEASAASWGGATYANGGGGAGGTPLGARSASVSGKPGRTSSAQAPAGEAGAANNSSENHGSAGRGGAGGAGAEATSHGVGGADAMDEFSSVAKAYAGGGGGGVGRILIRVRPAASLPGGDQGTFSPSEEPAFIGEKSATIFTPERD